MSRECEVCSSTDVVDKKGRTLCMTHWIETLGRSRSNGMMERVYHERERRERTESAVFDPAQLQLGRSSR